MSDNLFALLGYRLHATLDEQRRNEKSLALLGYPLYRDVRQEKRGRKIRELRFRS